MNSIRKVRTTTEKLTALKNLISSVKRPAAEKSTLLWRICNENNNTWKSKKKSDKYELLLHINSIFKI